VLDLDTQGLLLGRQELLRSLAQVQEDAAHLFTRERDRWKDFDRWFNRRRPFLTRQPRDSGQHGVGVGQIGKE
jgi:hypothetical protein